MSLNNPKKSNVPLPNNGGELIKYFNTKEGSEFIEAVMLHLETNTFDYIGAIKAGGNKAVDNGSIVKLLLATVDDFTPLITAIIRYIQSHNRLNQLKKRRSQRTKQIK